MSKTSVGLPGRTDRELEFLRLQRHIRVAVLQRVDVGDALGQRHEVVRGVHLPYNRVFRHRVLGDRHARAGLEPDDAVDPNDGLPDRGIRKTHRSACVVGRESAGKREGGGVRSRVRGDARNLRALAAGTLLEQDEVGGLEFRRVRLGSGRDDVLVRGRTGQRPGRFGVDRLGRARMRRIDLDRDVLAGGRLAFLQRRDPQHVARRRVLIDQVQPRSFAGSDTNEPALRAAFVEESFDGVRGIHAIRILNVQSEQRRELLEAR